MSEPLKCKQCGGFLPAANSPCPECLLQLGLMPSLMSGNPMTPKEATPLGTPERVFGDYLLLEELSRGGMGVVFKARQRSLDRIVAVKLILSGHFASPEAIQRFRMEASAAAALRHPNIVAIHEVGVHQSEHFLAMDFIDGPNLAEWAAQNGPRGGEPRRCAQIVKVVAEAMHYAHERGILHRDLKPSNILLDSSFQPHVTDFGIAKRMSIQDTEIKDQTPPLSLTMTGQVIGSPNYMPPEQAVGIRHQIGRHSDVYSLGALLYHILVGRAPFSGDTIGEILKKVAESEPAPLRVLRPDIPLDLETICLKCLAKDPRERYPTAEELALELDRFLKHEPIRARPWTTVDRVRRWARRNLVLSTLAATTALLLLTITIAAPIAILRINSARRSADRNLVHQLVVQGNQLTEEGDFLGALPWFAEALRQEQSDLKRARMHTLRLSTTLRQSPKLRQIWFHDAEVYNAEFSPNGQWVVTASRDGKARVFDVESGKLLTELNLGLPVNMASFDVSGEKIITACGSNIPVGESAFQLSEYAPEGGPDGKSQGYARIWEARTGRALTPILTHPSSVFWATISPNQKWAATMGQDHDLRIWNAQSGQFITNVWANRGPGSGVRFSPQSKCLVTWGADTLVRIWNADSWSLRSELGVRSISYASFSPKGDRLVTTSADRTAAVWDVESGALYFRIPHNDIVRYAAFSPDGRLLVTTANNPYAQVFDALTGETVGPPMRHSGMVRQANFSPDSRWVVTASADNSARVWDAITGRPISPPLRHSGNVHHALFSPDGHSVLSTSDDGTVRVWDLTSDATASAGFHPLENSWINHLSVSASNAPRLAVGTGGGVSVWDLEQHAQLLYVPDPGNIATHLSQDGSLMLVSGRYYNQLIPFTNGTAFLIDVSTGRKLATFATTNQLSAAILSDDNRRVATGATEGIVKIWEAQSGKLLHEMSHQASINRMQFSKDSRKLVTASLDNTARIWRVEDGKPLTPPLVHTHFVVTAKFSSDGMRVVSASIDGAARVWDANTGQPVTPWLRHAGPIWDADFSPDAQWVVTVSGDQTAQVWDAKSGSRVGQAAKHRSQVNRIAFHPEGHLFATAGHHAGGRLWDTETGEALTPPLDSTETVWNVAFVPGRPWLLTGSWNGSLRQWDFSPDGLTPSSYLDLASLLAGYRITSSGGTDLLRSEELRSLWQQNRSNHVSYFTATPAQRKQWHQNQAEQAWNETHWRGFLFHSDFSSDTPTKDPALHTRRALAWLQLGDIERAALEDSAYRFPPRDPQTPASCLDLNPLYNRPIKGAWNVDNDNPLVDLKIGLQRIGGHVFDVRGAIVFQRASKYHHRIGDRNTVLPQEVAITVGRRIRQLTVLHTGGSTETPQNVIGEYRILYSNGSNVAFPIRYGQDILGYWESDKTVNAQEAQLVTLRNGDFTKNVNVRTWTNPHPELEVATIEAQSTSTRCALILIAINAE